MRSTISPIGLVGIASREVFDKKVVQTMEKWVDHFIASALDAPKATNPGELKARDTLWRQTVVDNDPMQVIDLLQPTRNVPTLAHRPFNYTSGRLPERVVLNSVISFVNAFAQPRCFASAFAGT